MPAPLRPSARFAGRYNLALRAATAATTPVQFLQHGFYWGRHPVFLVKQEWDIFEREARGRVNQNGPGGIPLL